MMAFSKRMLGSLRARKVQLALAVRIAVAAVAAYAIAVALHLMLPLWAVLTSLIVTQMSVGRSLKATRDYMLGTVGGAIYGGAIAVLIPHSGEGGLLALLVLAVTPLAFIGAINPSLNTATVTAVIVLLVPAMNHANPLDSAFDRVLEVTVGAVTGLLVSFLVLPSRAISQIRVNAAKLLELLAAACAELLAGLTRGLDNDALHRIQDGIGAALTGLNATGAEAERERAAHLSSGPDTGPLLRTILRPAPRCRDDRSRQRRAAAGECPGPAGAAVVGCQHRDRRFHARGRGILAQRQRYSRHPARSMTRCTPTLTRSRRCAATDLSAVCPAIRPKDSLRWDFRWSRCGRTSEISTVATTSGAARRRSLRRPSSCRSALQAPCSPSARSRDRCGPDRRTVRFRTRMSARPNGPTRRGPAHCRQ